MADKKVDIDILVNTANSAKSVGELRKAMKDLSFAQEEVDKSSPDFEKLTSAINTVEGRIGDLNDAFRTFAGSGVERLNASTNLLQESFSSLDLGKLKVGLSGLKQIPGALAGEIGDLSKVLSRANLNFKTLGGSMKGLASSGVGELTKSVISLGKAILTNPLLLLASVIVGIVVAVVKFYDKIKPLKATVEGIGKAIDWVVQKLKDFADWLGITSFAAEKAAQKQIDNAKKTRDAVEKRYDREIKLIAAAGKDTVETEKKKQEAIRASLLVEIDGIKKKFKLEGDANGELKKQYEELKEAYKDSLIETKSLDIKKSKEVADKEAKDLDDRKKKYKEYSDEVKNANKELTRKLEDQKVESILNDEDREKEQAKLNYERGLKSLKDSKASKELIDAAKVALDLEYHNKLSDIENKYIDKAEKEQAESKAKKKALDDKELNQYLERELDKAKLGELNDKESLDAKIKVLAAQKEIDLNNAKDSAEKRALIEKEYQDKVEALKKEAAQKDKERDKERLELAAKVATAIGQGVITVMNDVAALDAQNRENQIKSNDEAANSAIASNNAAKDAELAKEGLTADQKAQIQYQYAMKEYQIKLKQYNDNMAIKKKEFENNKKMAIASALIQGALGVVNALSATPFMPMAIIGMALATITTGLSIAKIASQKFDGGGSPPTPPALPSANGGGVSGAGGGGANNFSAPQFYKLGQGGGGIPAPQKVIVTETDITKTQKNVQKIETRATQSL